MLLDGCISVVLIGIALKFRHMNDEEIQKEHFQLFLKLSSLFREWSLLYMKCFIFYFQTSALVVRPLFGWELPEFSVSALTRDGQCCRNEHEQTKHPFNSSHRNISVFFFFFQQHLQKKQKEAKLRRNIKVRKSGLFALTWSAGRSISQVKYKKIKQK